jgi:DNA invertase Pin-like site-specific DNA recombinase
MELPSFIGRKRPISKAAREERGERYCQLYAELGSYAAVAREVGFSIGTVKKVISWYERMNRPLSVISTI